MMRESFCKNGLNAVSYFHHSQIIGLKFGRELQEFANKKARPPEGSGFRLDGLAVTYFRVRMHTIIGANPFHGPVRDGKEWFQVAIAAS